MKDKMDFISKYKFDLSAENSNTDGYVTEKIIQAWAAGCIPVYWGSKGTIKCEFNREAFIDCNDFVTISDLADYLIELENDKDTLEKMLSAPILLKDSIEDSNRLQEFLKKIFEKPESESIQRLSKVSRYGKLHEQMYRK